MRVRSWWLVAALAVVGAALFVWSFAGGSVVRAYNRFADADLSTQDQLASVWNMWVGVVALLLSLVVTAVQLARPRRGAPVVAQRAAGSARDVAAIPALGGMASLRPPEHLGRHRVFGRDELIERLVVICGRRREAGRITVLHGLGGSGKTTVAQQVAGRLGERGVTVWWVSAATEGELHTGMRQVAARAGAGAAELAAGWADHAPDLLFRHLERYPGQWLLIIDNADDARLLAPAGEAVAARRGWVRPLTTNRGAVLVTSRSGGVDTWGTWCRLLPVEPLSTADGARILIDLAGPAAGSTQEAEALADRLGGLPLALGLAGRTLADAARHALPGDVTRFADYGQVLMARGPAAVFGPPGGEVGATTARGVLSLTWELSLDLLTQRGLGPARALLRIISVYADAPIPYRVLFDPAMLGGSPVFPDLDAFRLRTLLDALCGVGLINFTDSMLDTHPLIRQVSRQHLVASGDRHSHLGLAVRLLASAEFEAALLPHTLELLNAVSAPDGPRDDEIVHNSASTALLAAEYLARNGLYSQARDAARQVVELCTATLGPRDPLTLRARVRLADWTGQAGDFITARDQLAALAPEQERAGGADDPETLLARRHLAYWTGEAGDRRASRDLFVALLPDFQRRFGDDDPRTLDVRRNVAYRTGRAGDYAAARDQSIALVGVHVAVLGPDDPETLTIRRHAAFWTGKAGDPAAARDAFQALLPDQRRACGEQHPHYLTALRNVGRWTGEAGDPAHAAEVLSAALALHERYVGPEHPDTLLVRAELIRWAGESGDPASARDQYAELVRVRTRVSGPDNPYTLNARAFLAEWTARAGDPAGARGQLVELLPVRERVLGPDHPDTQGTRDLLDRLT